jgi:osmotically-inducible protein OsmY
VLGQTLQNSSGGLQGRFLRQNRTGQQFVGSDQGDVNTRILGGGQAAAGLNALIQQQLRPQGQQRQRSAQPNQTGGQGNRGQQTVYRVSREAGFTVQPSLSPAAFSERLTNRVNRSTTIQADTPIEVEVRGRTAILRGSVPSDRARVLAAQLVLLEPGVDQVDNQLEVAAADAEPQE